MKSCVKIRLDERLFFLEISSNKNVLSKSWVKRRKYISSIFFFNEIYNQKL